MSEPARRVALIGDVHAEDALLERVLPFVAPRVDAILCVGDIADGKGSVSRCCTLLARHGVLTVRGNHERWFLSGTLRNLSDATDAATVSFHARAFLESLPATRDIETVLGTALLCHGLGANDMATLLPEDTGYALESNVELWKLVEDGRYRFVFNGHTHRRMVRAFEGLTVINAGTLKRDRDPGFVVIDFETREVQCFSVGEGVELDHTLALPLQNELGAASDRAGAAVDHPAVSQVEPDPPALASLRIVTWNTWFDPFCQLARQAALWREIDALSPDVVCLQELLLAQVDSRWLPAAWQRGYWAEMDIPVRYGVGMCVRLPVAESHRLALPSTMGRELLVARLRTSPPLTIATVHLESTARMSDYRVRQLDQIRRHLSSEPNVLLVGDMNFAPDAAAESRCLRGWIDAWAIQRPDEPGFTVDSKKNEMRFVAQQQHKQERIDRVFLRCRDFEVRRIDRIGTAPLDGDPLTFPSDHFGLVVDLNVVGGAGPRTPTGD